MKKIIKLIKEIFCGNNGSKYEPIEESLEEKQAKCEHHFVHYRFAKGGGRTATCSKCGYVKHFPRKSN